MSRYDRTYGQPGDVIAERTVLGEVLERPDAIDLLVGKLEPKHVFDPRNRFVLEAMLDIRSRGEVPEVTAVHAWLDARGHGKEVPASYLAELFNTVPVAALEQQIRRIRDMWRLRELALVAGKIEVAAKSWAGDVQQIIDRAEHAIRELNDDAADETLVHVKQALIAKFKAWQEASSARGTRGVNTGFRDIDRLTRGMANKTLTYLAARPGQGKSALAMNVATNVCQSGAGAVVVFSLEMNREELLDRQLSSATGIPLDDVRSGKCGTRMTSLTGHVESLSAAPLWIDDRSSIGMLEIRAKCRRVHDEASRSHGVGLALVVVDYAQLIAEPPKARSREQAIAENSRDLKRLAKDLDVPVLALAQMNRDVEKREGAPRLSDLRESGQLEQDADMVWFIHREDKKREDGRREEATEATLIVAKQRSGPAGRVPLRWCGPLTRFSDAEPSHSDDGRYGE